MTTNPFTSTTQIGCMTSFRRTPVSYEQAKQLKAAGFEQRTAGYFINGNLHFPAPRVGPNLGMNFAECIPAPYVEDILNSGNLSWKTIISN